MNPINYKMKKQLSQIRGRSDKETFQMKATWLAAHNEREEFLAKLSKPIGDLDGKSFTCSSQDYSDAVLMYDKTRRDSLWQR